MRSASSSALRMACAMGRCSGDARKMCSILRVIASGRSSDRKLAPRACLTYHSRCLSAKEPRPYQHYARNAGTLYSPSKCCDSEQTATRQDDEVPSQSSIGRKWMSWRCERWTRTSTPACCPRSTGASSRRGARARATHKISSNFARVDGAVASCTNAA